MNRMPPQPVHNNWLERYTRSPCLFIPESPDSLLKGGNIVTGRQHIPDHKHCTHVVRPVPDEYQVLSRIGVLYKAFRSLKA